MSWGWGREWEAVEDIPGTICNELNFARACKVRREMTVPLWGQSTSWEKDVLFSQLPFLSEQSQKQTLMSTSQVLGSLLIPRLAAGKLCPEKPQVTQQLLAARASSPFQARVPVLTCQSSCIAWHLGEELGAGNGNKQILQDEWWSTCSHTEKEALPSQYTTICSFLVLIRIKHSIVRKRWVLLFRWLALRTSSSTYYLWVTEAVLIKYCMCMCLVYIPDYLALAHVICSGQWTVGGTGGCHFQAKVIKSHCAPSLPSYLSCYREATRTSWHNFGRNKRNMTFIRLCKGEK